jgi:protein-S-isoprenylcysteine O-methyltransferase Ste14
MKKRIRINGAIIFLAALSIVLFPKAFLRLRASRLEVGLAYWGMALVMMGLLLRVSSRGYKAENSGNGHALVMGGPYRMVRNPMYLGILCIGTGVILVSFRWWVLGVFIVFLAVRYYTLIVKEEKLLTGVFGEEYTRYKARVPRLFPRNAAWLSKNLVEYLPLRRQWLLREINSIIIVPVLVLALEIWKWLGVAREPVVTSELIGFILVIGIFVLFVIRLERNYENFATQSNG